MRMAGIRFIFAELLRETKALKTMGTTFFDLGQERVLNQFLSNLESIGGASGETAYTLNLQCLQTRPSKGEYEAGSRRGGQNIHAVISGTWEVRPLGNQKDSKREIEFCGNASTKIELYTSDEPQTRLAMWRLELGADDAPGCYIHAQILGDSVDPPFPKSVPIPRLPSIFVTPMSAVEFVLGEVFQDGWARAAASNSGDAQYWRARQKWRLKRLFSWYQSKLENAVSSPWMALKEAKPDGELFLEK